MNKHKEVKERKQGSSEDGSKNRLGSILKWAAGATTILTLIFGLQKLFGWLHDNIADRNRVKEFVELGAFHQNAGHYAEAWKYFHKADSLDHDNREVNV